MGGPRYCVALPLPDDYPAPGHDREVSYFDMERYGIFFYPGHHYPMTAEEYEAAEKDKKAAELRAKREALKPQGEQEAI